MALLWYDGFNGTSNALDSRLNYTVTGSPGTVSPTNPRTGNAVHCRWSNTMTRSVSYVSGAIIFGFGFRVHTAYNGDILRIYEGATIHLSVYYNATTRVLSVYRGGQSGTLLATGTTALPVASQNLEDWRYVEFKATIHDSTGSYELRIDDAVEVSGSGVDTRNAGAAGVPNSFAIGRFDGSGIDGYHYDDLYVADGSGAGVIDFIGSNAAVHTLLPNGTGDFAQWTPSSGANWQTVDETAHNSASDYNSAATAGLKDALACANLPASTKSVKAVRAIVIADQDAAGSVSIQARVRSGATSSSESNHALTTVFAAYLSAIQTTDPNTAADWTESGVNGAQVEYERTL